MRTHARQLSLFFVFLGTIAILLEQIAAEEILGGIPRGVWRKANDLHRHVFEQQKMVNPPAPPIEHLAKEIDWLEHHIETYGTIVPKQPDVWGEARLTRHREEFEKTFFQALFKYEVFQNNFQAAIAREDIALTQLALSLGAQANVGTSGAALTATAASSAQATEKDPPPAAKAATETTSITTTDGTFGRFRSDGTKPFLGLEPTINADQFGRYLNHLNELRRLNEGDDVADSPGYALDLVRIPISVLPGKRTREGFGAEITVTAEPRLTDDLLPTTFRNLVTEDLLDQISLPLAQLFNNDPQSALELMGVIDRAAADSRKLLPMLATWVAEDAASDPRNPIPQQWRDYLTSYSQYFESKFFELSLQAELIRWTSPGPTRGKSKLADEVATWVLNEIAWSTREQSTGFDVRLSVSVLDLERALFQAADTRDLVTIPVNALIVKGGNTSSSSTCQQVSLRVDWKKSDVNLKEFHSLPLTFVAITPCDQSPVSQDPIFKSVFESSLMQTIDRQYKGVVSAHLDSVSEHLLGEKNLLLPLVVQTVPASQRVARNPLAGSFLIETFGSDAYSRLAIVIFSRLNRHPVIGATKEFHLIDVRRLLKDEVDAAYELLQSPQGRHLWEMCRADVAQSIRTRNFYHLARHRENFMWHLPKPFPIAFEWRKAKVESDTAHTITGTLAWGIIVHSALLNERLIQDMRDVALARGCATAANEETWPRFFLPAPLVHPAAFRDQLMASALHDPDDDPEEIQQRLSDVAKVMETLAQQAADFEQANAAFKEYVRCRWPVRVFALDPTTQDQNVADVFTRRRELQLAMAVAVAGGKMRAAAAERFSRALETEIETIALNRTAVAFSHGSDTFGWRFYPRVQTPPMPRNVTAWGQTILGGPTREQDMRDRELEPGIRECVAVVVMPSFVPYVDFHTRTNWFNLTNPRDRELTLHDAMHLSRSYQAVKQASLCAPESSCYRAGDIAMLRRAVDQIDRKMPLQSMLVQVPYENTTGGFELFSHGITDLSPELLGWYGAPGIRVSPASGGCASCGDLPPPVPPKNDTAEEYNRYQTELMKYQNACLCGGTTLFLVGKHFSVLETRVIAGGVCVPQTRLLSREIMQVTIPPSVNTVKHLEKTWVDLHLATPYGVTSHLLVPVVADLPAPKPATLSPEIEKLVKDQVGAGVAAGIAGFQEATFGKLEVQGAGMAFRVHPIGNSAALEVFSDPSTEKLYRTAKFSPVAAFQNDPRLVPQRLFAFLRLKQGKTEIGAPMLLDGQPLTTGVTDPFVVDTTGQISFDPQGLQLTVREMLKKNASARLIAGKQSVNLIAELYFAPGLDPTFSVAASPAIPVELYQIPVSP